MLKIRTLHQHFTAHFQDFGQILTQQPQRNRAYGAHIRGHILARFTIATGRCLHQNTLLITQINRQPIEFDFHRIFNGYTVRNPQTIAHPCIKGLHFARAKGIGQRQHRHGMTNFVKLRQRRTADTLGRRIGGHQLGMLRFKLRQFTKQRVILSIGDARRIVDIVSGVVCIKFSAQFGNALLIRGAHRVGLRK